jgi:PAS domain S-box-containing protein
MLMTATKRGAEAQLGSKVLRESEASFHTLIEAIATPIFISRGKRLHSVNHAAEVITGYTREELLSINFCDLVHPDDRKTVIKRGRVHQKEIGLVSEREVRILTKNHEERWLDITATAIDFDGESGTLISAFDVTERKQVEAQAQLLLVP